MFCLLLATICILPRVDGGDEPCVKHLQGLTSQQSSVIDLGVQAAQLGLNHKLGPGLLRKALWGQLNTEMPSLDHSAPPTHGSSPSLAEQMFSHR